MMTDFVSVSSMVLLDGSSKETGVSSAFPIWLSRKLWRLCNPIMYYWNAMNFLVKSEGRCWQSEVLLCRQKALWNIIFTHKPLLVLNFCHVICHACAIPWDFSLMISCVTRVLSCFFLVHTFCNLSFYLSERAGLYNLQRSLPTSTILWFCDSVIVHWSALFQALTDFCIELVHNSFCFDYFHLGTFASVTYFLLDSQLLVFSAYSTTMSLKSVM